MVLSHSLSLAPSTIVMVWISSANVRAVVEQGLRVIHAASDYFYLDCGAGGWLGNGVGTRVEKSWCEYVLSKRGVVLFEVTANAEVALSSVLQPLQDVAEGLLIRSVCEPHGVATTFDPRWPGEQFRLISEDHTSLTRGLLASSHSSGPNKHLPRTLITSLGPFSSPCHLHRLSSTLTQLFSSLSNRPRAAAAAEVFWTGTSRGSVRDALPRLHDWRYRAVRRGIKASPLQPH